MMVPVTPAQERECLLCNPFESDRDMNVVLLSDKFVTARKAHIGLCHDCAGEIGRASCRERV